MIALDARPFVGLKNSDAYGIYNPPPPRHHKEDADGVKRDLDDETSEIIASTNTNANEEEVGKGAAKSWHPLRFRGARRWKQECAASECKLVAKDFWKRGFDRWVVSVFLSFFGYLIEFVTFLTYSPLLCCALLAGPVCADHIRVGSV